MPSVIATLQALVVELRATIAEQQAVIAEQQATIVRLEERVRVTVHGGRLGTRTR